MLDGDDDAHQTGNGHPRTLESVRSRDDRPPRGGEQRSRDGGRERHSSRGGTEHR